MNTRPVPALYTYRAGAPELIEIEDDAAVTLIVCVEPIPCGQKLNV
jgi:hypothetical protein